MAGGWNHLRAPLFNFLALGQRGLQGQVQLGLKIRDTHMWSVHVAWASHSMGAGSKRKYLRRDHEKARISRDRRKLHGFI